MSWKYFKESEFTCKCGCGFNNVDSSLVDILDSIRDKVGFPLQVLSGSRCATHNKKVGGVPSSAHTKGKAADILMATSNRRYKFLSYAFLKFPRVGVYDTFIHVDIDESKPQWICWTDTKGDGIENEVIEVDSTPQEEEKEKKSVSFWDKIKFIKDLFKVKKKISDRGASMASKPGVKSTEFWAFMIVAILIAFNKWYELGIDESMINNIVYTVIAYIGGRSLVKLKG